MFAPLETDISIRLCLIPILLGLAPFDVNGDLHQVLVLVLAHSVKKGGLAIRNSVDTATYVHEGNVISH